MDIIDDELYVSKLHKQGCAESRIYFMQAGILKMLKVSLHDYLTLLSQSI